MTATTLTENIKPSAARKANGWAPVLEYQNGGRVVGQQRFGTLAEATLEAAEMVSCIRDHPAAFTRNHPDANQCIDLGDSK